MSYSNSDFNIYINVYKTRLLPRVRSFTTAYSDEASSSLGSYHPPRIACISVMASASHPPPLVQNPGGRRSLWPPPTGLFADRMVLTDVVS